MQAELVERASRGDQEALESLAAASIDRCYALAYRSPAWYTTKPRMRPSRRCSERGATCRSLREQDRFDAWLHRLVVNACYAEARGERRWAARVRVVPLDTPVDPDVARGVADRDELEGAFRRLSPEHRAVVVLHHHMGYPLAEIAETLGIPVGTARSRLHYAVRHLRTVLDAGERSLAPSGERPS